MLPAVAKADESPEGPGREGNKPLMRNRSGRVSHPRQAFAGNILEDRRS
jgi:hypothetical protein